MNAFDSIYFGLAIWRIFDNFVEAFVPKFFGLAKYSNTSFFCKVFSQNVFQCHFYVRPLYLHVFAYIFICRVTIFKLADGLKIRDIK